MAFAISSEEDLWAVARYFGVERFRASGRSLDLALHNGYVVWEPHNQGVFTRVYPPKDIPWIDVEKLKEDVYSHIHPEKDTVELEGWVEPMSRRHPLHTDIVERTLQVDLYENPHFPTKPVELGKYKITLEKL